MKLTVEQMCSLSGFFRETQDPRRAQGKRHHIHVVLALAAGAVLCGMRGYKAISDWTDALSPRMRERFGCRFQNGKHIVPSESTIRNILIRVEPVELDQSLAIDGKTMCNAIDEDGKQTHIMSAVGHQSGQCYTQKKSVRFQSKDVMKKNKPTKSKLPFRIDWNYDEDRSRIAKGYGPENITRLRRFAVGLLKSKGVKNVSQKMRQLLMTPRMVLDYLKLKPAHRIIGYVTMVDLFFNSLM